MSSEDRVAAFLAAPRTVTALLAVFAVLVYYSQALSPPPPPMDAEEEASMRQRNGMLGLGAAVFVFLWYSICQGPRTKMIRPHPVVWRFVTGVVVVYLLALVWMLFQTVDDARQALRYLDPDLGVDLGERRYGADCRLFTPEKSNKMANLVDTLLDEFVIAHTAGWMFEAFFLRDYGMLFFVSVMFELMELTFQHWLPNFNECWWDSWILDVLICNNIGIFLGMKIVKYLKSKEYHWTSFGQQKTLAGKFKRGLGQFTPHSFDDMKWAMMSGPTRLLQCLALCVMNLTCKVLAFFLKYLLWIPPTNPINTIRLVIWFSMATPATLEWYEYINAPRNTSAKVGVFVWLLLACIVTEILICVKFGRGEFVEPWPAHVLWFWGATGSAFLAFMGLWYLRIFASYCRQKVD